MEAHTPKRQAVEKLVGTLHIRAAGWEIRAVDQQNEPIIDLQATRGSETRSLQIHTRQVTLEGETLDESTAKLVERWIDSLNSAAKAEAN